MLLALNQLELPIRLRMASSMTDQALERFSSENETFRIERDSNGELIVSPCNSDGGAVELNCATELAVWARSDGRGKVFGPSAGFTLPDTSIRAADAAWVSRTRWNALTESQRHSFAPICPEFLLEVRSDSDRLPDIRSKMDMWITNGAELAWLIDPERRAVEIYRPNEAPEIHDNPTSIQGTGPVRGFELILANVWED
jgi:Uma2 family endonuclease